jgi:hypothetical protein
MDFFSGLLSNPFKVDPSFKEGVVTYVDPKRYVCNVETSDKFLFSGIPWLVPSGGSGKGGMTLAPKKGDKVLITTATGDPIILGCLPRPGVSDANTDATGGSLTYDGGSPHALANGRVLDPKKPLDFGSQDFMVSSETGGMISLLREGTAILRGSKLAQVIVSRFNNTVTIVSRNFRHMTDWGEEVVANLFGRVYKYTGFNRDVSRSKTGVYEYEEILGDVVAGEYAKSNPQVQTSSAGATNSQIYKRKITNSSGSALHTHIIEETGRTTLVISNSSGSAYSSEEKTNAKVEDKVVGATTTRITLVPGSIDIDYGSGTSNINLSNTGVVITHGSAAGTFDSTKAELTFGSHYIRVSSIGVEMG